MGIQINGQTDTISANDGSMDIYGATIIPTPIPTGVIVMWSGTIANIPTGWALCNGSNGTPDLRNRFIVGAHSGTGDGKTATSGPGFNVDTGVLSSNYTPGNNGGETAHQLTIAELAAHTHTYFDNVYGGGDSAGTGFAQTAVSSTTGSSGGSKYHENRPPYYALAFIMKT